MIHLCALVNGNRDKPLPKLLHTFATLDAFIRFTENGTPILKNNDYWHMSNSLSPNFKERLRADIVLANLANLHRDDLGFYDVSAHSGQTWYEQSPSLDPGEIITQAEKKSQLLDNPQIQKETQLALSYAREVLAELSRATPAPVTTA